MTRQPLPNRRQNTTVEVEWRSGDNTHAFTVTVGCDAAGQPREVFCSHAKGDLAAMLADICVLISIGLQWGIPPADLAKSLGRVPAWVNGVETEAPASPVGAILAVVQDAARQADELGAAE